MKDYFDLDRESLRAAAAWAFPFVERGVARFEELIPDDPRPRLALEAMGEFAETGARTQAMRVRAMDAYRASLAPADARASQGARAASLGAALAYTHPFRDVKQAEHLLGPVAYAALAGEGLDADSAPSPTAKENPEVTEAIASAPETVTALLREYPPREPGRGRKDRLLFELDRGLRARNEGR